MRSPLEVGTSCTLSAIIWAASTRSRQFFRSKVISPKAQTLFPSRPARPCHSGAHPGQSHLRTCQKYRIWMARFLWRTTTPFSARPPLMTDQPARISLLPPPCPASPPTLPTTPFHSLFNPPFDLSIALCGEPVYLGK